MKDFFGYLNSQSGIERKDIIEKDYHIHRILREMSEVEELKDNLAFKGGTCLIKAYLDYYRFSEDIDFTWKDKSMWKDKTKSQVARSCSEKISELASNLKVISDHLGLTFSGDKTNTDEVHITSSGRMVDFSLGYRSEMLDIKSRIKIEINFVDINLYPYREKRLKSYLDKLETKELQFLYEEPFTEYTKPITIDCYDLKELFIEKCRAAMTRKTYKLRDMFDIYYLEKEKDINILKLESNILKKTKFMIDLYKRVGENIEVKEFLPPELMDSKEMELLLIPPPKDLEKNITSIHRRLDEIKNKIQ